MAPARFRTIGLAAQAPGARVHAAGARVLRCIPAAQQSATEACQAGLGYRPRDLLAGVACRVRALGAQGPCLPLQCPERDRRGDDERSRTAIEIGRTTEL